MPNSVSQRRPPAGPDASADTPTAGRSSSHLSPEGEIDFLARRGVPAALLASAAGRAASHGTLQLEELFALGFARQRYWSMLADELGLRFVDDLTGARLLPDAGPLATDAIRRATSALIRVGTETILVTAPGRDEIALLRRRLEAAPVLADRIRIAAPESIRAFIVARRHPALTHYALNRLAGVLPRLSAGRRLAPGASGPTALLAATLALSLLAPAAALTALGFLSTLFFVNCSVWKLAAAFRRLRPLRLEPIFDARLPTYAVLVPLYREAGIVRDLVAHLGRIDYPALCIKSTTDSHGKTDGYARQSTGLALVGLRHKFAPRQVADAL